MSVARTLLRNVVSNWLGYAVQIAVAFFLTPFVLQSLGEARYGVWTVVVGLTGYYGLLDLGFSAGITQYLTRHLARKDLVRLSSTASTGIVTLTTCGIVVFVISLIIASNAGALFRVSGASPREVGLVIAIAGASVAVQFAFFTHSAVFTALQRFDLSNLIGVATRGLSAIATVIVLRAGYGIVGLSFVVAGTNAIDYVIRWRVATRLLPLQISARAANRTDFSEIMKFGIWNLAVAGSVRLIAYSDSLVIAAFLPVAAVAPFAIAANLRSYFDDTFVRVGYVFYPAAAKLDSEEDRSGLARLYLISTRFMLLASVGAGCVALMWAHTFFGLWVGHRYSSQSNLALTTIVFVILLPASMVTAGQRIGYQVLLGMRRVSVLAALLVAEGGANLALSLWLVRVYGVVGVAIGTLIPAVVVEGFVQPVTVCRCLGVSVIEYARSVLMRPLLLALILVPATLLRQRLPDPDTWLEFFAFSGISLVLTAALAMGVGLTASERARFVSSRIATWLTPRRPAAEAE